MNNFTKVLLSVPLLLTTVACGADRIVKGPNPFVPSQSIEVNCTQKEIFEKGEWKGRKDYPGFENFFDVIIRDVCN